MKAEPSRLIPRKPAVNLELLIIFIGTNVFLSALQKSLIRSAKDHCNRLWYVSTAIRCITCFYVILSLDKEKVISPLCNQ